MTTHATPFPVGACVQAIPHRRARAGPWLPWFYRLQAGSYGMAISLHRHPQRLPPCHPAQQIAHVAEAVTQQDADAQAGAVADAAGDHDRACRVEAKVLEALFQLANVAMHGAGDVAGRVLAVIA